MSKIFQEITFFQIFQESRALPKKGTVIVICSNSIENIAANRDPFG